METLKQTITRQDEELKQLTRKLETLMAIVKDKMKQKTVEAKPLPVINKSITEAEVLRLVTEEIKKIVNLSFINKLYGRNK